MRRYRSAAWIFAALLFSGCSKKPASIDLSPKKLRIVGLERSHRLSARLLNKKGEVVPDATANWSSSNPEIADVEVGGRVVAKKEGKAMVTASYEDLSAQVPVEVVDVNLVEVSPPAINLIGPAGTTISFQATVKNSKDAPVAIPPEWSTSDPKVVTVSPEGIVTSVGPGTATLVARVGDIQGVAEVRNTLREIARLKLRPETALVRVGDSQAFEVVAYGADGAAIPGVPALFSSSDPSVATVDGVGRASGIGAGTATIRAKLGGRTAQATLLVN